MIVTGPSLSVHDRLSRIEVAIENLGASIQKFARNSNISDFQQKPASFQDPPNRSQHSEPPLSAEPNALNAASILQSSSAFLALIESKNGNQDAEAISKDIITTQLGNRDIRAHGTSRRTYSIPNAQEGEEWIQSKLVMPRVFVCHILI